MTVWLRALQVGIFCWLLTGCIAIPVTGSEPRLLTSRAYQQDFFTYQGHKVEYELSVPSQYRPGWPIPVLISIQDPETSADQQENVTGLSTDPGSDGYLIVYLRSYAGRTAWNYGQNQESEPGADFDFFQAFLHQISIAWDVDPNRRYLVGWGHGAEFAYTLGCVFADQVTAVALVAGQYPADFNCQPSRPLSVLMIHATQDPEMPYQALSPYAPVRDTAAAWAARNACDLIPANTLMGEHIQVEGWAGCREATEVLLFSIHGGSHSWPDSRRDGGELDASSLILQFFGAHTRRD